MAAPSLCKRYLLSFFLIALFAASFWIQALFEQPRSLSAEQPLQLYANQNGDSLIDLFLQQINHAEHSITLIIYTLKDPRIISALRHKGQEGVNIRVICDANASPYAAAALGKTIKVLSRTSPALMHQKILVVDEVNVWIGSANMTKESLELHGNLVMAIQSQEMAKMILQKADTFCKEGKSEAFDHGEFIIEGQEVEVWFLPDEQAMRHLHRLIRSAQKTIKIAMFTWTHYQLAQSVIAASRRGVQVQAAVDYQSAHGTSAKIVQLLKENGVAVTLGPPDRLLHHKFLYIDDSILVNGSANWTITAFSKNDDCFVVLHSLSQRQKQCMDSLWKVILRSE